MQLKVHERRCGLLASKPIDADIQLLDSRAIWRNLLKDQMVYWKTLPEDTGVSGQDNKWTFYVPYVMSFPCTRDTMRDEAFKLTLCDSRRQKSFHVLSDRVKIMLHMAMDAVHQGDLQPGLLCFPSAGD